jgi:Fe-S-cluster-containing dehydrogenase component
MGAHFDFMGKAQFVSESRNGADRSPRPPFGGASHEFFPGATHWPADLSRREFLQLMGASLALAGLTACGRATTEKIVPYVTPPEMTPSPDVAWYATALPWAGFARGILVKSMHGRPIKFEGNPDHPESLGSTDAVTQAAVLSLYDPDRSATPQRAGQLATWEQFGQEWSARRPDLQQTRGAGLALLTEPTTSPTQLREIHALLDAWPEARWFQHTALARFDRDGVQTEVDFAAADVVLSIGADFLFHHPAALRHARGFATRRRVEEGRVNLNRVFALESTLSLTGAQADWRLALAPSRMPAILNALARSIEGSPLPAGLSARESQYVSAVTTALSDRTKIACCVVGEDMPVELHRWADRFNRRFGKGAVSYPAAVRSDGDPRSYGGLENLVAAIKGGGISTLYVLGSNPVYTAPGDLEVAAALKSVSFSVHLGGHVDETAERCQWHLPQAHFLETWSDLRAYSGVASLLQPLIEPLHASRSVEELLHFVWTGENVSGYDLVRETWHAENERDFDRTWHGWLNRGVIENSAPKPRESPARADTQAFTPLVEPIAPAGVTVLFRPDANVFDGRWANNAWLQELPRPLTALVWENAALIADELAKKLKLKNGDVITGEVDDKKIEAPVWILPGQAADCITLPLGYGRIRGGATAQGRGFSAYALRTAQALWQRDGVKVTSTGRHQTLVTTQEHFSMEGRDPVRVVAAQELGAWRDNAKAGESLFPAWKREGYAWGMSIDLSTCFGCNACVIACQAENNIPVVGRDQVARGREMHWIRIDRYYSGQPDEPRVLHQPVACVHCESAPCEVVCPVGATVHTSEGLNDMIYNRCVGTRYCSNNCPYKVRRFNFLDYRAPKGSTAFLQTNPDVTVRERGVMEKCTYCVQRINAGRIAAEKENRRVRDGEIRTACQQACPVEAIVFGDLADPTSRVVQRKREATSYLLLGELNTKPRTSYLAKVLPEKDHLPDKSLA